MECVLCLSVVLVEIEILFAPGAAGLNVVSLEEVLVHRFGFGVQRSRPPLPDDRHWNLFLRK